MMTSVSPASPAWASYNAIALTVWLVLAALVATANVLVDPGAIYLQRVFGATTSRAVADSLLTQPVGLPNSGNERQMKHALAEVGGSVDCVLLGSSRILQVSSVRAPSSIGAVCASVLNLGVSGGTLEDLLIFTRVLLQSDDVPRRVLVGTDPWMLKFGMDARYAVFEDDYTAMLAELHAESEGRISDEHPMLSNLLNAEYFRATVASLWQDGLPPLRPLRPADLQPVPAFDVEQGWAEQVLLADGSIVYSTEQLAQKRAKVAALKVGGGAYKIQGPLQDPKAVALYTDLLRLLLRRGVDVSILLMPYHPTVYAGPPDGPLAHIIGAERQLRELGATLGIPVVGSYDPARVGCTKAQFHDDIHPAAACMNQLAF